MLGASGAMSFFPRYLPLTELSRGAPYFIFSNWSPTMRGPSPMPAPRGMNVIAAAKYMGVSAGTFRKLVRLGIAPQPMNIPEVNRNIYDREAIDAAMTALAAREVTS
jgi:hypothetical protein